MPPEDRQTVVEQEPIGIIIASGHHEDVAPRFSAYIYGLDEGAVEPDSQPVLSASAA